MNKFEIIAWGFLISSVTAVLCGAVLILWLARKEVEEVGLVKSGAGHD